MRDSRDVRMAGNDLWLGRARPTSTRPPLGQWENSSSRPLDLSIDSKDSWGRDLYKDWRSNDRKTVDFKDDRSSRNDRWI